MKNNKIAIVSGIYIALQMLSDILSLRILYLFGLSIDGGTLVYPLTFTVRDLLHKFLGKRGTQMIIILAALINIFMALAFWLVSVLPPDLTVGVQAEFGQVLAPFWRIVFASIVAEVISEFLDTEMYAKWQSWYGNKKLWGRVLFSNLFSIPVDSLIFVTIAFLGQLPLGVVGSIFVSNVIIKYFLATFSLPTIYINNEKA